MEMYPRFFITHRCRMLALWVEVDERGSRSIWDLPAKQATPEVLRALQSAFARGVEAATSDDSLVHRGEWERRIQP